MSDNDIPTPNTAELPIIPKGDIIYKQEAEVIDEEATEDGINDIIPDPASFKYLGSPKRKVIKHGDQKHLVILRSEITERGAFGRKTDWNNKVHDLRLLKNGLVDHRHARKVPFIPLDDEDEIRCLMRHNWWSHGPKQVVLLAIWLVGVGALSISLVFADVAWGTAIVIIEVAWTVFWATRYYPVWMRWAHDWIIVTDKRLILIYDPPFKIVGDQKTVMLSSIITVDAQDSSWFQNMIGCGSMQVRTADKDQNLDALLVYINEHKRVSELLLSAR